MIEYMTAMFLVMLGAYALLFRDNLVKKIIGLGIMTNGINLFIVSIGYRIGGIAPILRGSDIGQMVQHAVDPLPQALVLTSIVISLSVTAVALSMIVQLYRKKGTANSKYLKELNG